MAFKATGSPPFRMINALIMEDLANFRGSKWGSLDKSCQKEREDRMSQIHDEEASEWDLRTGGETVLFCTKLYRVPGYTAQVNL